MPCFVDRNLCRVVCRKLRFKLFGVKTEALELRYSGTCTGSGFFNSV